jgi:hypothetical protein
MQRGSESNPKVSISTVVTQDSGSRPSVADTSLGSLIQIDGSDHEWFEDRAVRRTLLVFVDDATSEPMGFLFRESAFSYFAALRSYPTRRGARGPFGSTRRRRK